MSKVMTGELAVRRASGRAALVVTDLELKFVIFVMGRVTEISLRKKEAHRGNSRGFDEDMRSLLLGKLKPLYRANYIKPVAG